MSGSSQPTPSGDQNRRHSSVMAFLQSDLGNAVLYFTRIGTIFSCIAFFIAPLFSISGFENATGWYRRALIANAVTSALRLRQRISAAGSQFSFSRNGLALLVSEDSFHYVMFSVIFVLITPVTVALLPIFLFAIMHSAQYTLQLLESCNRSSVPHGDGPASMQQSVPFLKRIVQTGATKVGTNSGTIFRLIAVNEVLLMLIAIVLAVSGPRVIILPFAYYNFLKLRYASRRNPYCRYTFYELRTSLEQLASHPYCPMLASRAIHGGVSLVSRLCPPVAI